MDFRRRGGEEERRRGGEEGRRGGGEDEFRLSRVRREPNTALTIVEKMLKLSFYSEKRKLRENIAYSEYILTAGLLTPSTITFLPSRTLFCNDSFHTLVHTKS